MKFLELFSGIGGFRRALDVINLDTNNSIFECIGFSEIDKNAIKTYTSVYDTSNEVDYGDISTILDRHTLPNFDFLLGGFPCQSFSIVGHLKGFDDERGLLFFDIVKILKECKPKYVLLENVAHLVRHDNGNTFKVIRQHLEDLGYNIVYDVFNTKDYALPQSRRRVYIFATLEELPLGFEHEFTNENISKWFNQEDTSLNIQKYNSIFEVLSEVVDDKYYLSDKMKYYVLDAECGFVNDKDDINQTTARTLLATMHKMHRASVDNYYTETFIKSKGQVNESLELSRTELEKLPIRKLTPEECFMLQGFPRDFVEKARSSKVSNMNLYKQAGNAVSVNVVYAIVKFLINSNIIKF